MDATFAELRRLGEQGWGQAATYSSGADALASVLELVRQHQVGLGLRVWGLGLRVWGLGLRVSGLGGWGSCLRPPR